MGWRRRMQKMTRRAVLKAAPLAPALQFVPFAGPVLSGGLTAANNSIKTTGGMKFGGLLAGGIGVLLNKAPLPKPPGLAGGGAGLGMFAPPGATSPTSTPTPKRASFFSRLFRRGG